VRFVGNNVCLSYSPVSYFLTSYVRTGGNWKVLFSKVAQDIILKKQLMQLLRRLYPAYIVNGHVQLLKWISGRLPRGLVIKYH